MGRLDGKVVVVTGANSGVGEAACKLFAKEGAKVVLAARRVDKLENVKFYSEKCGFIIESTEKDGNVKVVRNYPLTHFILT